MEIEMYMWMAIGALAVGFLAKTYWDVYQAWRAWSQAEAVRTEDLVAAPVAVPMTARRVLGWLGNKADRFLHAMLMSPTAR